MPSKRRALAETDANASPLPARRAKRARPSAEDIKLPAKNEVKSVTIVAAAETQAAETRGESERPLPGYHTGINESKRWSKVSNSANIDLNYRDATRDPAEAYSYICMCHAPRFATEESKLPSDDTKKSPSVEKNGLPKRRVPCDFGETCICKQPASQHPGHEWILSYAGYYRFGCQRCHAETRNPENFRMRTFKEHESYGAMEVVQNLFLDFEDARQAKNWREQWGIVEATAMFLLSDWGTCIAAVDDGEMLKATAAQVARMVLSTFATLEQAGLMKADSEVRNIGLVMAMYLKLAYLLRQQNALEPSKLNSSSAPQKGAPPKATKKCFDFNPTRFASYVLTYSIKHSIPLYGVEAMGVYTRALDAYITLPKAASDPWGWADSFNAYKRSCELPVQKVGIKARRTIGGDAFDVTTWSSAQRVQHSWVGRDALGRHELGAIRDGFVLDINHR